MIFRLLICLTLLLTTSAQAGVAAYEQCVGSDYESRLNAKFAERFPTTTCDGDCDPWLMKSVEGLVRAECRAAALDDCESQKCRLGLQGRWTADEALVRMRIAELMTAIDMAALPALQARRLSDPSRWSTTFTCTGDATTCAAARQGQSLGDAERILTEVEALQ
ncbi:MAG: hypothetical protein AAF714_02520 [Pseudomonadota bacterium]